MPGSPERDAPDPAARGDGPARTSDALRTAGAVAGADLEARLARQRVASALFGAAADGPAEDGEEARRGQGGVFAASPSGAPERVGGRYELERVLGAGGMGVVYAAWDPELQRRVAIKLIHEDLERAAARVRPGVPSAALPPDGQVGQGGQGGHAERAAKTQARMLREARALARLSHPNVIHVYDVGTYDGRLFVAMELVEGETLRQWLDAEAHEPRRIMEHLLAAGRGLEAAHRSGLVHRDFKPENVLIGADGRVRVVDFGLARLLEPVDTVETAEPLPPAGREADGAAGEAGDADDAAPQEPALTSAPGEPDTGSVPVRDAGTADRRTAALDPLTLAGVLVGTPRYMAPEQLDGLPADAASDQFAFCVAAWEALTGRPPFVAATVDALRTAIRAGALEAPASSSRHATRPPEVRAWLALIERGLQHEPQRRWSSMTELLAALSLALAKPKSRRRTSKRTVALAMVLGAAVMAALPLLIGPRVGVGLSSFPGSVATSSAQVLLEVASSTSTATRTSPDGDPSSGSAPVALDGEKRAGAGQASGAAVAASGEAGAAALPEAASEAASEAGPPVPTGTPAAKGDTGVRDMCHLHEDTYELLSRGPRKRQLEHEGTCFECRVERRRSRTSRFSPADCGAYALCAPSPSDACR